MKPDFSKIIDIEVLTITELNPPNAPPWSQSTANCIDFELVVGIAEAVVVILPSMFASPCEAIVYLTV